MIEYEGKKLYVVTVEYQAYVLAEDEAMAELLAEEIVKDETPEVRVLPVLEDHTNPLGWPRHALVYHHDQDIEDIDLGVII